MIPIVNVLYHAGTVPYDTWWRTKMNLAFALAIELFTERIS
jgi:hypothetical protein